MTRPLLVFGATELAQLAKYYFCHDIERPVAAFTVDDEFVKGDSFEGLPLIPFSEAVERFPPADCEMFVAIGYTDLNGVRAGRCLEARSRGYRLASCISRRASVWEDLQHGDNCFIMEGTVVQPFVRLGNNVIVCAHSTISHHVAIADDCFIAAGVTLAGAVTVGKSAFVGVNATISDHVGIGEACIIGAGAIITRDTAARETYVAQATQPSGVPSHRFKALL